MAYRRREISMGFTERPFLSGSHICYLFGDDDERFRLLARYLAAGSRDRERILYLSDTLPVDGVRSALLGEGAELGEPGQSVFLPAEDGYLSDGKFSSQATLEKIRTFFEDSISAGYRGARGTGEMSWALRGVPGVEDVMDYEYGAGAPIEIEARSSGELALLRVRDHGVGIAQGDQVRLFRRFERAAGQRGIKGAGLGLWIVRQIAEAFGGTVELESELGHGAQFTVRLPRGPTRLVEAAPGAVVLH
jgi:catechol 2,3-dioxygenase-like lactoylglutathione lyase family enzyme